MVSEAVGLVEATDRLSALAAELAQASVADLAEPDASRVHGALRRAQDVIAVVAAKVLARVEADGRWANTPTGRSAQDLEDWLAKDARSSRASARRQAQLARVIGEEAVPGLSEAVADGSVSVEHAHVLSRLAPTTPARREALTGADPRVNAGALLAKAARLGVEEFGRHVRRWAASVDPDADERGHRDAQARVSATWSDHDDTRRLTAVLTHDGAATVQTALSAVAGVPAATDARSHVQRMGAALVDMARLVLDHGLGATQSGAFRPHLSVHVGWDTLVGLVSAAQAADERAAARRSGNEHDATDGAHLPAGFEPAALADGTPIPASVLARLACDAEVSRVVFGPDSQILDVGRERRLFTGPMRRAIIARDRCCAFPGCDRPPRLCEVHHIQHWVAHRGVTSTTNGVLLCYHHHDVVHSQQLTISRDPACARWEFVDRHGALIPHPGESAGSRAGPVAWTERHRDPGGGATHDAGMVAGRWHQDGAIDDLFDLA